MSQEQEKWLAHLENWFNQVLALDNESLNDIQNLSGKVILLELLNSELRFFLQPNSDGFHISTLLDTKADVTIRAPASEFMLLFFSQFSNKAPSVNMEVIGDIGLGQQFQNIMLNLEIDWEEPLSNLIGDTATHKLSKLMRDGKDYSAQRLDSFTMNLSEYLRFESNQLPDQTEVDEFIQQVDAFRNDVDRVEQRINKIINKIEQLHS